MIEDGFKILECSGDDPELMEATVKCKACESIFELDVFILQPKNCVHDLGKSITVICPNCKARHSTSKIESRLQILERTRNDLLNVPGIDDERLFKNFFLNNFSQYEYYFNLICEKCKTVFDVRPDKNINGTHINGKMTIKCPGCDNKDEMTKEIAVRYLEGFVARMKIKEVEKQIAELKEEWNIDNKEEN